MFAELRNLLNENWTTVAIEQQGHGHTADVDRPLRFNQMADDTAAVVEHLGLKGCHAFGYSDGGNVALGLAIRHSEQVARVAVCGTNANNSGLEPAMLKHLLEDAKKDPDEVAATIPKILRDEYKRVASRPQDWPQLVHRVFELAASFDGWTEMQLHGIKAPVLVMAGDQDVITQEHTLWLARQCQAGQLCILPRTDHLAPVSRAKWIAAILHDFLEEDLSKPMPMEAAH
jgi:pimeloyl-ACP methyl ester carboxylesterase